MAGKRLSATLRRERIISAAANCLAVSGYLATSMDEIASASGISKPVLYDHFPSKEDLYLSVLRQTKEELLSQGASILQQGGSVQDGFRRGIGFMFAYAGENPDKARLLFMPPQGDPVGRLAAEAIQREATERIAGLLLPVLPGLSPSVAPGLAEFVKSGIHGFILWWLAAPESERAELEEAVAKAIWFGFSAFRHPH